MSDSCLFCRIVRGEIPAKIIHEDDHLVAFRDLDPKAPTHVLVVPKRHIATLDDARDGIELGALMLGAAEVARREGLVQGGYRTVINCGKDAGQTVFHLHVHVLGGRELLWPPG